MSGFLNIRAGDGFAITPSDSVDFDIDAAAIYVGGTGTVVLVTAKGNVLTFVGVPAGTILPIDTSRVNVTSTTATAMIGLTL